MKSKNWLNILTPLVAAMFIISLFSGAAAAQKPAEPFEKEKEQYRIHKGKYDRTKEQFEKAKEEFERAREKFRSAKDKISRDEAENKTKEYLIKAIDHTIAHLEVLKDRVENSENKGIIPFDAVANINAHIAQLEQLRTKVQQAETIDEFRKAHQELKDVWIKIRLETRYYLGILLNHRIDSFITKADNVSARMDAEIQKLESQGKDTTKLEEEAEKFNELVNEAKDIHQKTLDLFTGHSGFDSGGMVTDNRDASDFIREAGDLQKDTLKKLKAASKRVLEFVKDFRKLEVKEVST